ncbi:sterile alpha motif domain-containing protein 14 isoform X2 [Denticeps clupeoides]|uniref:sterile alpha motif domain-containing protein 14 isoform X2 n=1 Tax=Denticeps clupeoides TaxID=299321 RepID=UPI0010A467E1|nr:sterile alpha motif domain-containing protein 14 isoform X2 [Denticeps clupeoides]
MSATQLEETENVFDLNEAIPETELLDNSIQKGRAQLSVKTRRHRPSRSRFRDSVSSTEGDESLERKHSALRGSSPSPDALLCSSPALRSPAFSFDTVLMRRSPEEGGTNLSLTKGRYRQLTNTTSQEALVPTPSSSPSKSCPSSDCSPVYLRRARRPESEVLVSDDSQDISPPDPSSPTVIFDKKTKRRFLDLGVTLRRSYVRVRKDKTNRLSMGSREPSESPSRSSGSFVPFSWFMDGHRGSGSSNSTPSNSPRLISQNNSPRKSNSQESALSDEFSPRSPPKSSGSAADSRSSHPYQTLSQSSDEPMDEPLCLVSSWSTQQVCQWLRGLNMEQYIPEFTAKDIDGEQLLQMDGTKLKGLGVINSSDRNALKRQIKDIHATAEKERKALDKLEKQKEKQRKKDQEQRKS